MRKRERENPCGICGHYHKYEEGEPCSICGHRLMEPQDSAGPTTSAFASEIVPGFLYCGSYDNASRSELLKAQGISRILNTVPTCQNLYQNSFSYHTASTDNPIPFEECITFLESCRRDKAAVLVHCMTGISRSPAVVTAYLMRANGWSAAEAEQFVRQRHPSTKISEAMTAQLSTFASTPPQPPQQLPSAVASSEPAFLPFDLPSTLLPSSLVPPTAAGGAAAITAPPALTPPPQSHASGLPQPQPGAWQGLGSAAPSGFVFGSSQQTPPQ